MSGPSAGSRRQIIARLKRVMGQSLVEKLAATSLATRVCTSSRDVQQHAPPHDHHHPKESEHMNQQSEPRAFIVDRERFSRDGDIARAMSADIIATTWNSPPRIRQPFTEGDALYVTTSMAGAAATAYRLVPTTEDAPEEKSRDGITNRKVRFGDQFFIIQGPP